MLTEKALSMEHKSTNITWHESHVTRQVREALLQQRGSGGRSRGSEDKRGGSRNKLHQAVTALQCMALNDVLNVIYRPKK